MSRLSESSYRAQDELEEHRYRLCMDDDILPNIRDRQTISDVKGAQVPTGLERFENRAKKFRKLTMERDYA